MSGEWTPERVAKAKATREQLGPRLGHPKPGGGKRWRALEPRRPRGTGASWDAMRDGNEGSRKNA